MFDCSCEKFEVFLGARDVDGSGEGNRFAVVLRFGSNKGFAMHRDEGSPPAKAGCPLLERSRRPLRKCRLSGLNSSLDIRCIGAGMREKPGLLPARCCPTTPRLPGSSFSSNEILQFHHAPKIIDGVGLRNFREILYLCARFATIWLLVFPDGVMVTHRFWCRFSRFESWSGTKPSACWGFLLTNWRVNRTYSPPLNASSCACNSAITLCKESTVETSNPNVDATSKLPAMMVPSTWAFP